MGDAVLREAAAAAGRALARAGDLVARVGGDEFAWLMPETAGMEAWRAADRAREAIAGAPFPGVGHLTISAGVCDLTRRAQPSELFRLADGALYWAKQHGRDVAFLYSPEVVEVLSDAEHAERLTRLQALQSIRVLARAVDAKDPSTRQHSERVAELAQVLAHGARLDRRRRVGRCATPAWSTTSARSPCRTRSSSSPTGSPRTSSARVKAHAALGRRDRRRRALRARRWPGCAGTTSAGTGRATRTASAAEGDPRGRAHPHPRRRLGRHDLRPALRRAPVAGGRAGGVPALLGRPVLARGGRRPREGPRGWTAAPRAVRDCPRMPSQGGVDHGSTGKRRHLAGARHLAVGDLRGQAPPDRHVACREPGDPGRVQGPRRA